jgi:NTP pyrophosphatase (non-canonical NTP hydrolase)
MNSDAENLRIAVESFNEQHDYGPVEQGMTLAEETGELCEAVMRDMGLKAFKEPRSNAESLEALRKEIGDVVFTVATIAHLYNLDAVAAGAEVGRENLRRGD